MGLLRKIFARHGMEEEFRRQEPMFVWEIIAGNSIGGMTQPLQVKNRILYVQVSNHSVQHELNLLKEEYIEKVNDKLGDERLKDIKFKVVSIDHSEGREESSVEHIDLDEIDLDVGDKEDIEDILGELGDEQLNESFRNILIGVKKVEKVREDLGWSVCERCGAYYKGSGSVCPACRIEIG